MKYPNITKGKFIERLNRFVAIVEINGHKETVHVKNTGRCKELLIKDVNVYLTESDNKERKTRFDLVAVQKTTNDKTILINMDSQSPNQAVKEWLANSGLFTKNAVIRQEVKYKNSRFDFYIEDGKKKAFLEVKGVTLEQDGTALFPDAPTERGIKHINELIECQNDGFEGYIVFVIQMKGPFLFIPNIVTHKAFAETLQKAKRSGVKIIAVDCIVTEDSMTIDKQIETQI